MWSTTIRSTRQKRNLQKHNCVSDATAAEPMQIKDIRVLQTIKEDGALWHTVNDNILPRFETEGYP